MNNLAHHRLLERVRALSRTTRALWERVRAASDPKRFWLPPLAFFVCATGFAYAHSWFAWGSYMRAKNLPVFVVPPLFGALYGEFAAIGVVAVWSYRSRWLRLMTWLLLAFVLVVNSAQLVSTTLSNEFITSPVVRLAPLLRTIVSFETVLMVCAGPSAGIIVLWIGFRRAQWKSAQYGSRLLATGVLCGWGLALFGATFLPALAHFRARQGLRPEAPVFSLYCAVREAVTDTQPRVGPPNADELRVALRAGLTIHPEAAAPFRKDWIYKRALPFPKRDNSPSRPNVIVFFFESWSAEVLGPYNPRWTDVTPNLNDFAQHAMRVDDYINHAIPTVTGLRGQLCSMFPSLAYTPWNQPEKPDVGRVLCLPKLLGDAGYESVYLNHGAGYKTHFDSQVVDWGFEHAYFLKQVLGDLLKNEAPGHLGEEVSDEQMIRATIAFLDRKSAQSTTDQRPLFLAVSTFQTHTGVDLPRKFGNGQNPVLNTFSNLDHVFGDFWRWYQTSKWAKDTILILTGDHILYPHDAFRQVATSRHLNDRFGYLGLFIMDPTHELPASYAVRSTSIDFAPTLIQLLGLPSQQPNPFMGLSMFSDRQQTPIALGFNYGKDLLFWERTRATPIIYHTPKRGVPRQLFNVLRYEQQLERDHRIWFR
jgi:lipoteichoic acid synthase